MINILNQLRHHWVILLVLLVWLSMVVYLPDQVPSLGFDEGWTLSVARNWVESGKYVRLLDGEFISAAPMVHPSTMTLPTALSFTIFGTGVWQGRLPGAIYTLGAFLLLYFFTKRLYGRSIAIASMVILLFLSNYPLHPILIGRMVLAEMPMIFFLLLGYWCFWKALQNSPSYLVPAMVIWGLALATKKQPLPFWSISLAVPCLLLLFKRKWNLALLYGFGWIGSLIFYVLFSQIDVFLTRGYPLYGSPLVELLESSAVVSLLSTRLLVIKNVLLYAPLFMLGQVFGLIKIVNDREWAISNKPSSYIKLSYLSLSTSWLVWYLFMSVGWSRYLFPVIFLGSTNLALFISTITNQFNFRAMILDVGMIFTRFQFKRAGMIGLVFILLLTYSAMVNTLFLRVTYDSANDAVSQVVQFINQSTPQHALVETYDSELFFMLQRHYHYPPDQVHVDLNRRLFLQQNSSINYDPLAANPDYLVVGQMSKLWGLYEPALTSNAFQLVLNVPGYQVYQRLR